MDDALPVLARYQADELIGKGGMARVYRGHHLRLGNTVAIKMLTEEHQKNLVLRQRFLDEARIQANLKHPGIVQVSDIVDEDCCAAIVMEFLEGLPLDAWLAAQGGVLTPETYLGVTLPLVEALSFAHSLGVIHRDLKPGNVFLCKENGLLRPKLMDFGIAKLTDSLLKSHETAAGTVLGTPHYMAPEQFEDAATIDARADIWSLGVMSYRMLSGRNAFAADTLHGIISRVLMANPAPLCSLNPQVPQALMQVLNRAMAKRRDDRFATMEEFGAALRGLGLEPASLVVEQDQEGLRTRAREGLLATTGLGHGHEPSGALSAAEMPTMASEPDLPKPPRGQTGQRLMRWGLPALAAVLLLGGLGGWLLLGGEASEEAPPLAVPPVQEVALQVPAGLALGRVPGATLAGRKPTQADLDALARQLENPATSRWVELQATFECERRPLEAAGDVAGVGRLLERLLEAQGFTAEEYGGLNTVHRGDELLRAEIQARVALRLGEAFGK
jgi:tRNA A-37 threonylcarbamoyl transferase component Bud32